MRQPILSKSFAASLLLHAGLLGLLVLAASMPPGSSDRPLRVRILEPSESPGAVSGPPPPAVEARPGVERHPGEVPRQASPPARLQSPPVTERMAPRPAPIPDTSPIPDKPPVAQKPVMPAAPPQVAALPTPAPAAPRGERMPETPREAGTPTLPERSGLSLGGPAQAGPPLTGSKGAPLSSGPARPSLRDQIASLGSGLTGDVGEAAKRTISLDSREEHFVEYLARLKRRVQRVWHYPEEAVNHGISGELLIIFTLNSSGSLTYIRLIQSSGFPILDEEALQAVKLAAPFDPFVPQMGDEPLNISATFHYDLPRPLRRN